MDRHGLQSMRDLDECRQQMASTRMQCDSALCRLSKLVTEYEAQAAEHEKQRLSYLQSRELYQSMLQDAQLEVKRATFAQRRLDCSDLIIQEKQREYLKLCGEVAQQSQQMDALRTERNHFAKMVDQQSAKLTELSALRAELKESKLALHSVTSQYEEALSLNFSRMMEMEESSSSSKLTPPPEPSLSGSAVDGAARIPFECRRRSSIAMIEPMESMDCALSAAVHGAPSTASDSLWHYDSLDGDQSGPRFKHTPMASFAAMSSPEMGFDEEDTDSMSARDGAPSALLLAVEEDDEFEVKSTVRLLDELAALRQRVRDRVYDRFLLEVSSSENTVRRLCRENGWKMEWFVSMMQRIQMLFVDAQMMADHEGVFVHNENNEIFEFAAARSRGGQTTAEEMAANIVQFESLYGDGFNFAVEFVTALMEHVGPRLPAMLRDRASRGRKGRDYAAAGRPAVECLLKEWYGHLVTLMANRFCARILTEIVSLKLLSVQSHDEFLDILCSMVIRHPLGRPGPGGRKRDVEKLKAALDGVHDANIRNHVSSYFMKVSAVTAADVYRMKEQQRKRKAAPKKSVWKSLYGCESAIFCGI